MNAATNQIYIIAEAGVNHNGSLETALQLVDTAVQADADAVKFQTFRAANVATAKAPKAEYQERAAQTAESQLAMIRGLELPFEAYAMLQSHCRDQNIDFLSTPFDLESLAFLAQDLDVPRLKMGSGEITNGPLLLAAARTGKDIILSTGMCTTADIEAALALLAFGYTQPTAAPSETAFQQAYAAPAGKRALARHVTLLHCTTEYPAPFDEINLNAIATLRDLFGLPVGLSDHSQGIAVPTAGAALGAAMVEKHFTLDSKMAGPDHAASLEPAELTAMITAIRQVEAAMGSGTKQPTASERANMAVARKSLVALQPIKRGERFTAENLGAKRPGNGISPLHYWQFLDRPAGQDYEPDDPIRAEP